MHERLVELMKQCVSQNIAVCVDDWETEVEIDYNKITDYLLENEVVEVRHGKWKEDAFLKPDGLVKRYPSVKCSECEIVFCDIINNHNYMYRYCPHCGAKMDKGEEENAEIIYSK